MKSILILLIGLIIMSPCLLMLNDSGNILPNIIGFIYTLVLCVLGSKQWAKHLFIKFMIAFKTIATTIIKIGNNYYDNKFL